MAAARRYLVCVTLVAFGMCPVLAQQATFDPTAPGMAPGMGTAADFTTTPQTGATEVSSALQLANQAFQLLVNRQFPAAKQMYQDAASADPRYQKMVEFVDNIMTRYQDLVDESWELERKFNNPLQPDLTLEQITDDDMDKMLDMQLRLQMAQGDLLGEFTLAELGLVDAKDADTLTLGEYLGWRRRKTVDFRIYDQIMRRVYERQMRYARLQFLIEQRQERQRRREELRQVRFEVQGGAFAVGAGGLGGIGLGGYGGGGGFGGGGFGGGGFTPMMGGFGGGFGGGFD